MLGMRVATSARLALGSVVAAQRFCSTSPPTPVPDLGIAPKKPKRRMSSKLDVSNLLKSIPSEPGAHAELSTAELERKVEEWSKMSPEELDELYTKLESQEVEESRVLVEDSLYQMDVSLKNRSKGAIRVFWKDVDVCPLDAERYPGWYAIKLDGRKVKAFESNQYLAIPSEVMAYCCAKEFSEQKDYLNKLIMPLTDVCSGAMQVAPQMINARIDYLLSFYQNDNTYFRAAPIQDLQDKAIEPIANWFGRSFGVEVPRIVGIGHPQITPQATLRVRDALIAMNMNPYQIVAFCVVAQFTSSLLLPLALFNNIVDLPTALWINRAEEGHNIETAGMIEGYHDIRESDVITKICACATAWRLMKDIPLSKCVEVPRNAAIEEAELP